MGRLKNFPPLKFLYRFEFLRLLYHFCLSFLAAFFYRFPSKKIFVIGITGTKGKTTVVELISLILEAAGKKTAVLSSLYFKIGDRRGKNLTENTMPGRFFVQRFLSQAVKDGCGYVIVEVTSEGVRYFRHRFINWNLGLITNLAPEHIESHGSFEKYRKAKINFLKYVASRGAKVFLNSDDQSFSFFSEQLGKGNTFSYSTGDRLVESFQTLSPIQAIDKSNNLLFRRFNLSNVAAAVAIAKHLGVGEVAIVGALKDFSSLPGRIDVVQWEPFRVVVDYAHTPESLEKFYQTVKEGTGQKTRLICVLGSAGGGRDRWKRPEMGKVAAKYCQTIILTDEDPYDEDPRKIISEIKQGILASGSKPLNVFELLDRGEAIQRAISLARENDDVVITGKGSEPFIHVQGGKRLPWSDREVAVGFLKKIRPR